MLAAMTTAPLGDDVYGEDPTVNRLEQTAADRLGKAAACFMPSGTMANLTSIMAHAPRGSKVLVGAASDIYRHEALGASVCGGIGYEPIANLPDGSLSLPALADAFPDDPSDPQFALPALICLENTQNWCGGIPLSDDYQAEVAAFAKARGVPVHLDGARIFNAAVALCVPVDQVARHADSVQFCLSKGLSAPIGSMVVGTEEFIARVRRIRKMLGGGMRQAGVVAAAGIVALEQMVDRLAEDHRHAHLLAEGLRQISGVLVETMPRTNIVLFRLADMRVSDFVESTAAAGVALAGFGPGRIRAVTHSGVDRRMVEQAVSIIEGVVTSRGTER